MKRNHMDLLSQLGVSKINAGAYCGSSWHSKITQPSFHSINPTTGTPLAEVVSCTADDCETIIQSAHQASLLWREVPAPKRGELIRQIGNALRSNKDKLGNLIALEMGKSKQEADGEVQEMIDMADFCVGQSRMLYGKTMHSERCAHRLYEQWHPYGVICVISAFNFPVAVWAWNAFLGAICGNVIIWKPSIKTPLCAIAVHHICSQILQKNNYPDVFSLVIPQSHALIESVLEDRRIPLISFTGSTAVGRKVATRVAARLGKTILELGGNNAIILDETARLDLAIRAIVFGAIGTAGQRCTSTRRLFIHKHIYQQVTAALVQAYAQVTIGDPFTHMMGPLIDLKAVQQFEKAIQNIQQAGGNIIYGGQVLASPGFFVQPTLVEGLHNDAKIIQQETFAPILYIMPYETLDEAIHLQNSVPQGLSSALFTQNIQHAEQYLSVLGSDCGIANVNLGTSGAEIGGAFGGEKDTGGGRESGSDTWKAYMRRQTNTINWGNALPLAQGIEF